MSRGNTMVFRVSKFATPHENSYVARYRLRRAIGPGSAQEWKRLQADWEGRGRPQGIAPTIHDAAPRATS